MNMNHLFINAINKIFPTQTSSTEVGRVQAGLL